MMRITLIFLALTACLAKAEEPAKPAPDVSLKLVANLIIEQTLLGDRTDQITTVQDQVRKKRGEFRRPPSSKYKTAWIPVDLVCVVPGGLEGKQSPRYDLALEKYLGEGYTPGSFAFSGRADSLVYTDPVGWGTENNNGDFVPYLIRSDFEEEKEPVYEIFWERQIETPDPTDAVHLNYVIKVPKHSKIQWGRELALKRFSFAGSFSVNAPAIRGNDVIIWQRGIFKTRSTNLAQAVQLSNLRILKDYRLSGFAVPPEQDTVYAASDLGVVTALAPDGKQLWQTAGRAPVITHGPVLLCLSADYRSIQILSRQDGKLLSKFAVPKFLPKEGNSFAVLKGKKEFYLLFQIPDQSRVLCYTLGITEPKPEPAQEQAE